MKQCCFHVCRIELSNSARVFTRHTEVAQWKQKRKKNMVMFEQFYKNKEKVEDSIKKEDNLSN